MFTVLAYIKFLWRSTNQHGVHSPYVYSLVTKCFYDRTKYPTYKTITAYRNELLKSREKIKVTDFGAGSRVFNSSEREVSKMAKTVGISSKRARLLNRLVRYLKVEHALELGTSLGIGTAAMAAGNNTRIITIEGCPATAAVAENNLRKNGFENIDIHVEKFEDFFENSKFQIPNSKSGKKENPQRKENSKFQISNSKIETEENLQTSTDNRPRETDNRQLATGSWKPATEKYDLIYFDGNHRKQPTLDYFQKLLPTAHNDTVFIFDDIHWSAEMEEAWEEIKEHPAVKVTVDTFGWGLVFFRKEQAKEHFTIRI